MKREEKIELVERISERVKASGNFYLADVSDLTVNQTTELRKLCQKKGIELSVSKNTFIRKALEKIGFTDEELLDSLKGPSSLMFAESINAPAKLIKEFRRTHKKPLLKAAYVEDCIYIGDDKLDALVNLKSRDELIADVLALLSSPMHNLIGALNSGKNNITGVLKTLSEKE
ncbi:MAG: 50S ribosomal protein L10 [Bacteroidetes bacterium]|jgi:large subunit ribosomal protein L10|nr:50S ribosomal protein L10 [Bacteroidota bacterium]MBT3424946.1 50S ribosomal protein L10 [Bacteroidota bacterium]MBT4401530.1 50S ribosomal protein L10 [Bacteroidota bacterium]MBT4727771.1 50S ribosomal protein L10 [Bacteroidota bacterium]MBT5991056.1 50S ribosomal protein L10 [Bacteroidota bacterium]